MHPLHASAPIANGEHLSHMRRHREGTGCPDWNGSSRIELDLEPGWRERLWAALARFRYSGRRPLLNLEAFKIVSRSATLFSAEAHARRCRLQTIQTSRAPAQPGHRTATCLLHTRPQWCAHLRRTLQRHRTWSVDRNSGVPASIRRAVPAWTNTVFRPPTLGLFRHVGDLLCHKSAQDYELGQRC